MTPFPISEANAPEHSADLPAEADVVVIGGGVIGTAAALFLARAGRRVVLCERGRIAGEQSSRNWGWVRVQGRDPAEIPIALEAQALWRALAPELDTDIGLATPGVLYLAEREKELAEYEAWLGAAEPWGLSSQLIAPARLAELLPGASRSWPGALWTPTDMRAEPFLAVPALARLAAREGAIIAEGCAVRGLDLQAGRIAGVITERGRVRAPEVIVAGGAWSSLLLRRHGVSLPQLSVRANVMRTAPLPDALGPNAAMKAFAFRRRADGGYTLAPGEFHEVLIGPDAFRAQPQYLGHLGSALGLKFRPAAPRGYPDAWTTPRRWALDGPSPFEAMRVLNPRPHARAVEATRAAFAATFPGLGAVKLEASWAGMIDMMPDVVPVVDRVAGLPGLTVATGMSGHGFGIGPAFGRIAADLAQGNAPGHDLARFRCDRFGVFKRPKPGPAL